PLTRTMGATLSLLHHETLRLTARHAPFVASLVHFQPACFEPRVPHPAAAGGPGLQKPSPLAPHVKLPLKFRCLRRQLFAPLPYLSLLRLDGLIRREVAMQ
ncbi:MAG: hypothetical protein ACRDIE_11045, partial [Chloroflexota bacterium]